MKLSQKSIVAEKWVINASPVISLARVGQAELLASLPEQAILPQAVVDEISNLEGNIRFISGLILK